MSLTLAQPIFRGFLLYRNRPTEESLPSRPSFTTFGLVKCGVMLCNFLPFMLTASNRCRTSIGNLKFDGAILFCSYWKLTAAYMLVSATCKVARLTNIGNISRVISDAILARLSWWLGAVSGSGVILYRSASFIDGHNYCLRLSKMIYAYMMLVTRHMRWNLASCARLSQFG